MFVSQPAHHALARWPMAALASLSILLSACGGGGGGGSSSGGGGGGGDVATLTADVYPLASGDTRTWRITPSSTSTGGVRTERIAGTATVPAGAALIQRNTDGDVEYLQKTASAVLSVPGPGSDALSVAAGPVELLRFGLAAGQTAVTFDRTLSFDVDADGRADSVALRIESTFVGYEAVDTPAGRFATAAHVRTAVRSVTRLAGSTASITTNLVADEWFAPGVGPVRSSTTTSGDGTPAQTDLEELTAYGVGSLRSETVAPTLLSTLPEADGYVSPSGTMTLNFSEPLDLLTLDGPDGVTLVTAAGVTVPATRSINQNGQQIVFRPTATLADGRYELRTGSAVTDLANNPLRTTARAFAVDTVGPRLLSSLPANGADDGALTGTLRLSFDEPIVAAGNVAVQLSVTPFPFTGTGIVVPAVIQGRDIVATLTTPLARNTEYFLAASAISDAIGNRPNYVVGITFRTDPGPLSRPAAVMPGAVVLSVAPGDVNNDGRRDLVFVAQVIGSGEQFVGARLQQADGSHAAPVRLHTLGAFGSCQAAGLLVADVDGDGRSDIALTGCGGIRVLRQQADASYVSETTLASIIGPFHIAATDRIGDGRAELVASNFTQFVLQRRATTGGWSTALAIDAGTSYVASWELADINGDGRADLVWLRYTSENRLELAWALREGTGFGATRSSPLPAGDAPWRVYDLAVGDVSGDGRPDVMVLTQRDDTTSQLLVLRQNATGGFEAPATVPTASYAATATVGDVDGDGRLDLVVTHSTRSTVGIYLQGSDGNLQPERLIESGYGYFEYTDAVALADLNGDRRTDLIVADSVLTARPYTGVWPLQAGGFAAPLAADGSGPATASQAVRRCLGGTGAGWLQRWTAAACGAAPASADRRPAATPTAAAVPASR